MLYAGSDLSRQRLDVHVMDEDGQTWEEQVLQFADKLYEYRHASARVDCSTEGR